jgi:hypothetical protein
VRVGREGIPAVATANGWLEILSLRHRGRLLDPRDLLADGALLEDGA